jgi:hypothetical protein
MSKMAGALGLVGTILVCQLAAPWMLFNLPKFPGLVVFKARRRPRGMYKDSWEQFSHSLTDGGEQEEPEQLNIRGETLDERAWSMGIDLEHGVFGWADWQTLLTSHGGSGGSGDLGVLFFGLPGVLLTSPLWVTSWLIRQAFEKMSGMSIEMWWVRRQLMKQLRPEDQRALDLAFKNHFNGAETTYVMQKTAEYQDRRARERFAESQRKQSQGR